jgi:hypothetical protein
MNQARKTQNKKGKTVEISQKILAENSNFQNLQQGNIIENFLGRRTLRDDDEDLEEFHFDPKVDSLDKVTETLKDAKGKLVLKVSIKERSSGIRPKAKLFTAEQLKAEYPMFLIEFYESKITCK